MGSRKRYIKTKYLFAFSPDILGVNKTFLEEFKKAILGTGFEVVKVVKAEKFITDAGEARKLVD